MTARELLELVDRRARCDRQRAPMDLQFNPKFPDLVTYIPRVPQSPPQPTPSPLLPLPPQEKKKNTKGKTGEKNKGKHKASSSSSSSPRRSPQGLRHASKANAKTNIKTNTTRPPRGVVIPSESTNPNKTIMGARLCWELRVATSNGMLRKTSTVYLDELDVEHAQEMYQQIQTALKFVSSKRRTPKHGVVV